MFHEAVDYYFRIALYLLFGILPSLLWLFYYVRKDLHPEPRRMILKVFFYGALVTIPVYILQVSLSHLVSSLHAVTFFSINPLFITILQWFFVIAFSEELAKYVVVKTIVFGDGALDEPLDIMLYMVVAALGFAAVENTIYLLSPLGNGAAGTILQTTATISFVRFISATFLHTLCSGLLGYFLALSLLRNKRGSILTLTGIFLATLLHGLYDFSIITIQGWLGLIICAGIIIALMIFMLYDFNEIKKVKSICKL